MRQESKRLTRVLALVLTIAALVVGQTTAMAETVTYTISGSNETNGNINFVVTASGDASGTGSARWVYNSTQDVENIALPGGIKLSFGSDKTSSLAVAKEHLVIKADGATGGYITLAHESKYIYHVMLKNETGRILNEGAEWNMTKSYTFRFQELLVQTIIVEYDTTIPITDAVLSGLSSSYPVSNAAVTPPPTVTWHGLTLTINTHYTLSYQNNTSPGTATVKATGKGIFATNTNVSANYTLVWATYTVRFNKNNNGASGTMDDQAFTYNTAQNLTANAFTRIGYTFSGWNTKADGSGTSYTDGQSVNNLTATDGATVNLYAQWTPLWGQDNGATGEDEDHAYVISSTAGLDMLAKVVNGTDGYTANNFDGKFFKLGADITYSYEGLGADESNFTAIGGRINGSNKFFRGTFDGDNKTISGIRIRKGSDNCQGLFGYVSGGTIKNVTLTDADITGRQEVGGIAGYICINADTGSIMNCHVTSSVTIRAVADYAFNHGGIVGQVNGGTVSGCTSAATLTVAEGLTSCTKYGGIVGYGNGNLENNLVVGASISGNESVGAVAGIKDIDDICSANYYRNCTVNGTANATGVGVGSEEGVSTPHDIDGVRSVHSLTLPTGVTASGESVEINGITYYAAGTTVTLSCTPGYTCSGYIVDGTAIDGNTFTMPAADVTVSATIVPIPWEGEGSGTEDDPYQISNYAELKQFANIVNGSGGEAYTYASAKLVNDIVCKNSFNDSEFATDWVPIGNASHPYIGTFDGQNHIITGLSTPTDNTSDYVGLFGYIGSEGVVKDVILEYATMTGNSNVGVVAGYNNGTLTDNYYISSSANDATINIGTGSGDCDGARGLYTITLPEGVTAATATVTLDYTDYYTEGTIVTLAYNGNIPAGYLYSVNGEPIAGNTFTMPASDVTVSVALPDYWGIPDGANGSESNPYIISTTDELDLLAKMVKGVDGYEANDFSGTFFKLKNSITYTGEGENYTAIGSYAYPFKGSFDGNNKSVKGICIERNYDAYQGLFGYLGDGGTVKRVTVDNADITGPNYVGGIVGYNNGGTVENCNVSNSTIIGSMNIGGIVGQNNEGTVHNCMASSSVSVAASSSTSNVGGIVGYNREGIVSYTITTSLGHVCSAATVSGNSRVGGIVGSNQGTVSYVNTYNIPTNRTSAATVSGNQDVGGIVGFNLRYSGDTAISGCISAATVSGLSNVGGIAGTNNNGCIIENCFAIGASISATSNLGGAIVGKNATSSNHYTGILDHNYYHDCTLTPREGEPTTSNIGCGNMANNSNGTIDVTEMDYQDGLYIDGARGVYSLILGSFITATYEGSVTLYGITYVFSGIEITINYESPMPDGLTLQGFNLNGTALEGTSFYMPDEDAIVSTCWSDVSYIDANGVEQTCSEYTPLGSSTGSTVRLGTAGTEAWYVVSGSYALSFSGDAHLILMDGAKLTVEGAHPISVNGNLTIYGQSGGTGSLEATSDNSTAIDVANGGNNNNGYLTINGGNITAASALSTGGTCLSAKNSITINRGSVTTSSTDGRSASGITSSGGDVIINGGTVVVDAAAGVGIKTSNSGNVTINGGTITATCKEGISSYNGDVIINGGTINSTTGNYSQSYSIYSFRGNITINGGNVTAISNDNQSYGIRANNGIVTLGWTNADDRITASSCYGKNGVFVKENQAFTDGTNIYVGTLTSEQINALAGKTLQPFTSYSYTLTAKEHNGNYWTTFYSSEEGYKINDKENACAYTATYSSATLTLHKLGKVIPAGTAVIIVGSAGSIGLTASSEAAEYTVENKLRGVDVRTLRTELGTGTVYVMGTGKQNGNFGFFEYTGQYMPAHKAYLLVSGGEALVNGFNMEFEEDDATGLNNLNDNVNLNEGIYNLAGQRISKMQKGINIVNGKKILK